MLQDKSGVWCPAPGHFPDPSSASVPSVYPPSPLLVAPCFLHPFHAQEISRGERRCHCVLDMLGCTAGQLCTVTASLPEP